jgi:hypothetical protein
LLREAEHAKTRQHVLNGRGPNDHCCEALVTHLLSTEAEVFNQTLLSVSYLLKEVVDPSLDALPTYRSEVGILVNGPCRILAASNTSRG